MNSQDDDAEQMRVWELLYSRLKDTLDRLGTEDWQGRADYWIVSDNWGTPQHKLYIDNLDLLAPSVVKQLQATLFSWLGNCSGDRSQRKGPVMAEHGLDDPTTRNHR